MAQQLKKGLLNARRVLVVQQEIFFSKIHAWQVESYSQPFLIVPFTIYCIKNSLLYMPTFSYSYHLRLFLTATPFNHFYQLLFPPPISYFYQLLVTGSSYYPLLYQLLLTVSATFINQSFQLLFSGTAIRYHYTYSYQLLASTIPFRYFYIYSTRILL